MKKSVILDKSFLDGASTQSVRNLCNDFDVLLSEELFFELITTRPESQKRCFSKFPDQTNPVLLVPNVGSLLRFEMEQQEPCTPVTRHKIPGTFQFNAKLRDGNFVFEGQVLQDLENWKKTTAEDTLNFIQRWSVVHQFFPELSGVDWKDFPDAIQKARLKVSSNTAFVRDVYASLLKSGAPTNAPSPEHISHEWAIYRWIQCQILSALRMFERYQGKIPSTQGQAFIEKAEHSMLDSYHAIYGCLVGTMATLDNEIRADLLLLHPKCALIPEAALSKR